MTPYWELLLAQWRRNRNDGLTVPYIIGSQKFLPASIKTQGIRDLVIDIIQNENFPVYATYCPTIGQIILGYRDKSRENIAGSFPSYNQKAQNGFYLTKILDNMGVTMEEVIVSLRDKFQEPIDNSKFSFNSREWGSYSDKEIKFIKDCFATF
jgi:hypothetical protein